MQSNSNCCMFWGVSAFTLLFSWWNSCSIGFKSGDWLESKTFHFFTLINSLTELAECFGSLSWCNMKHFPMNLVAFSWILVGKMVLYPSKLILLLSSYIKSLVKLRGPVPEAVNLRSFAVPFFFYTFFLSHCLDKGSSLSYRSINTFPKLFWLTFVLFLPTLILPFYLWCWSEVCSLLCSICNSVSKSPEDSRLSEHHPAFWKLLVILQTRILVFIFIAFLICLSSTIVVFSADQVIVRLLVSVVSKLLISPCPFVF